MDSYDDHPANKADPSSPNVSISGVYLRRGTTYLWPQAGALSTSPQALAAACAATNPAFRPYRTSDSLAAPNRCGAFDYYAGRSVQNGYGKTSAYLAGDAELGHDVVAYAQLLANRALDKHYYSEGAFTAYDPDLGLVTAQRIFLPDEVGGIKTIDYDERSWNLNAGVRGKAFDGRFDWDASVSLSRYDITTRRPRFFTNAVRDYCRCWAIGRTAPKSAVCARTGCSRPAARRCTSSSPPKWSAAANRPPTRRSSWSVATCSSCHVSPRRELPRPWTIGLSVVFDAAPTRRHLHHLAVLPAGVQRDRPAVVSTSTASECAAGCTPPAPMCYTDQPRCSRRCARTTARARSAPTT
ncbi:hypothetical protein NB693_24690 [Pantoea ananatis]|uniref:hypothetical protein n=1 Tax=Pantoea ananas TaxID=553 RepID=UPI0022203BD2|nr:hypothetical protein [Pantoea ananatis]